MDPRKTVFVRRIAIPVAALLVLGVSAYQRIASADPSSGNCTGEPTHRFGEPRNPAAVFQEVTKLRGATGTIHSDMAGGNRADAVAAARRRYAPLLETMDGAPIEALVNALDPAERGIEAAAAPGCVESEQTLVGTLDAVHADYFTLGSSETAYTLTTDDGQRVTLHPAGLAHDELLSNIRIRVHGYRLGSHLVFDAGASAEHTTGYDVLRPTTNPPVLGNQNTLVLLVNFQNATSSETKADVQSVVFGTLRTFYRDDSYHRIDIVGANDPAGDVYGWYTLPMDKTCTDIGQVQTLALAAANADVDYTQYKRLFIVAPFGEGNQSCYWGGNATMDRQMITTPDGDVLMSVSMISDINVNLFNFAHELGHNFGADHAGFLDCGTSSWAPSGCTENDYGDPYSVLGSRVAGHLNALHKEFLGWLDGTNMTTVTSEGDYTILPLEDTTAGFHALKVPRGNSDYLYVEYRQPIGEDAGLDTNPSNDVFTGALLHIQSLFPNTVLPWSGHTDLLDASPADANLDSHIIDPILQTYAPWSEGFTLALRPGSTFTDPATGSTVTVTTMDASAMTLHVTLSGAADTLAPRTTTDLSAGNP